MKKIILSFLLFTICIAKAQNAQDLIDGLKKDLKSNPDDKKRATIYSDLTWYYSNISIDSALLYGKKALESSAILKDSTLLSQVYSDIGAVYFRKGDYKNSKLNYLTAYKIRKSRNDLLGMSKINGNLANIYNKEGNRKLALQAYLETVDYFEKINNQEVVALTNDNIGFLFNETKNYSKALLYLKKAVTYQESKQNYAGLSTSYLTIGNVYLGLKDTIKALSFYNKTIEAAKKSGNKIAISNAMVNMGSIKNKQNNKQAASLFFTKSQQIRDSLNIHDQESILPLNLIKTEIDKRNYKIATQRLLQLKKIYAAKTDVDENLLQTYQYLIYCYAYLKQPDSAALYNDKASALQIKLLENNVSKQNNELETKYRTAKKEQIIMNQKAEVKQQNLYFIIASLLGLIAIVIGYFFFKQQKIKNAQQKQESALKETLLKIESENQLQEQRLGISKELHDNIGSQLTFVISSIDTLKQNYPSTNEKIGNQLENINAFTKNTITELRDTVWVMNTKDINGNALKERLLDNMERAKMTYEKINFKIDIDAFSIDNSVVALNLFRTIQEAINNALKYANATEIAIAIHKKDNQIVAYVKDNGSGFDIETAKKGNGLRNMKKRIQSVGGKFAMTSQEKLGTEVNIIITV